MKERLLKPFNLFFSFHISLNRAQGAGAAERARVLEEFWNRKRDAQRNRARGQVRWERNKELRGQVRWVRGKEQKNRGG